ncbi:MAG: MBL fold metallo-hydrolase [Sphaerochaeta sp.]
MIDIVDIIKKTKKKTFSIIEPLPTGEIFKNLYSIQDGDSNYFIYRKGRDVIAIDSGYKNSQFRKKAFENISIKIEDVSSIFLTHIDSDHAGCLYEENSGFKNSKIYLNEKDRGHLNKKKERLKIFGFKISHKLEAINKISYFSCDDAIFVGSIKIKPILTAGHTLGHTCFFVDDRYLFTGDSLILKNGEGYRFFDLLGFDNKQNSKSLMLLKEFAIRNNVEYIITSHTGISKNIEKAFKFCNRKFS